MTKQELIDFGDRIANEKNDMPKGATVVFMLAFDDVERGVCAIKTSHPGATAQTLVECAVQMNYMKIPNVDWLALLYALSLESPGVADISGIK